MFRDNRLTVLSRIVSAKTIHGNGVVITLHDNGDVNTRLLR